MKNSHKTTIFPLSNGLRVVHTYIPDFPIAISSFWARAGSRFDPTDTEGMAHFFEHLLTIRTKKFSDRQKRLIEIEKRGFLFNAHTGLEAVNYHFSHSQETLDDAVELLIDGYSNSIFSDKDIEEEKSIILDEERRNKNDPKSYIWRLSNSAMWPNSMMGSSFYGNEQTLGNIKKENILKFYNDYYSSSNTVFVLINSIKNIDNQIKKIESIKPSSSTPIVTESYHGKKNDIVFDRRDINNCQIAASFITTNGVNDEDVVILDLIKNYLASGWISRLITRTRIENKLTYWVNSESEVFSDTGFVRFFASVNQGNVQKFLNIFEEEILLLKRQSVDNSILDNHKNKYISDILRLSLNVDYLNWWYGSGITAYNLKPEPLQNRIEKIAKVTPDQIIDTANKYFVKNNFSLALIGREQEVKYIPDFN
jgi:predicted Zn-dependent peptidase